MLEFHIILAPVFVQTVISLFQSPEIISLIDYVDFNQQKVTFIDKGFT